MKPFHWLALPLTLAALGTAPVHAAGNLNTATGQAVWNAATRGKTTTIYLDGRMRTVTPAGGSTVSGGAMSATGSSASGGVAVAGSGTAPVNGKGVPVAVSGTVAKDVLAGAVEGAVVGARGGLVGAAAGAAVGAALPLALNWMAQAGVTVNASTGALEQASDPGNYEQSDGRAYYISWSGQATGLKATPNLACVAAPAMVKAAYAAVGRTDVDVRSSTLRGNACDVDTSSGTLSLEVTWGGASGCPAGWYVTPVGCYSAQNLPKFPIGGQELVNRLVNSPGAPDPRIVKELMDAGQTLPVASLQVSGPAQVSGPTTISITNTTNNSPTTTTTTTTNNYTYNGATITNTGTKTTTETKDKDGNTTSTTEETTTPGDEEQPELAPIDTPLGDLPKLYERKYPDGMVGIWNDKGQQLKQTQLFQLPQQLMPTGIGGGSCPSFKVPLDFAAFGDFGQGDVSPPCWVWDVAKVIVLIGAAILARALIFGG
jgi:hypothetical protein